MGVACESGSGPWGVRGCPARDPDASSAPLLAIDQRRAGELLAARPELRVDGARPSVGALCARLASFGLPDEPILYIGLAGTSLYTRLDAFYRTRLGSRSPHAGGWPLKCISRLDECWVHVGLCDAAAVARAEATMLETFLSGVSPVSRAAVVDPNLALPYANLEIRDPDRRTCRRKRHGITGATAPKRSRRALDVR